MRGQLEETMLPIRMAAAAWLAVAAMPAAAAEAALKDAVPHVTIPAVATAEVRPDRAVVRLGVVTERRTASEAAAQNSRAAAAVIEEVRTLGVEAQDLRTTAVTLAPVYDEERDPSGRVLKRMLRGYVARSELRIRVRAVERTGTVAGRLIEKGANVVTGISFEISDREERLEELRVQALQNAQRRARIYAETLGLKVGRVIEITPDGPPVPLPRGEFDMPMRAAAAEAAPVTFPIEPGSEMLRAHVNVTFELLQ
jgi:uncharacterized protein